MRKVRNTRNILSKKASTLAGSFDGKSDHTGTDQDAHFELETPSRIIQGARLAMNDSQEGKFHMKSRYDSRHNAI